MTTSIPQKYAIIGAGVSGSSCAFYLHQQGNDVDVFDKGRHVGGRFSTYNKDQITFDYGSTIINTYPSSFISTIHQWRTHHLVDEYQGRVMYYANQKMSPLQKIDFYVSKKGANHIVSYLLEKIQCHLSTRIRTVTKEVDGWWLRGAYYEQGQKQEGSWGPYDRVIFALPGPQFAPLILSHRLDWGRAALKTKYMPQWSVGYVFQEKLPIHFDLLLHSQDHDCKLISRESYKYEQDQEVLIVQMQYDWSLQHINHSKDEISEMIMEMLKTKYSITAKPLHLKAHLWRYAYPVIPHNEQKFLHDEDLGLFACGDWLSGGCIGLAYTCGKELAEHLDLTTFEQKDI